MRILLLLGLLLIAMPASAANYYFCDCGAGADADCVAGSDAAAGTSAGAAWKTYEKFAAVFSTKLAGDTLNFCKGGAFIPTGSTALALENVHGDRNNPLIVQDYTPSWASGDEGKPLCRFTFQLTEGSVTPREGITIRNLKIFQYATSGSGNARGVFFNNDFNYITLDNLDISGANTGIQSGGCSSGSGSACRSDQLTIKNSVIHDNYNIGFLGSGDDLLIQDNEWYNNGTASGTDHHIYVDGNSMPETVQNITILRNNMHDLLANDARTGCQSAEIVFHDRFNNVLVKDNYIHEDPGKAAPGSGCYGIAMDQGHNVGAEDEGESNVVIENNVIEDVSGIGIGITNCIDNCQIINNSITFITSTALQQTCIAVPDKVSTAPENTMYNTLIANNSCYLNSSFKTFGIDTQHIDDAGNFSVNGASAHHRIYNNTIQEASAGTMVCIRTETPLTIYDGINNNDCYQSGGSSMTWSNSQNLATWAAGNGQGFDSASTASNPLYISSSNLALQASSPAINAGANIGITLDLLGALRSTPPDMGAYEYGAGVPGNLHGAVLHGASIH